MRLPRLALSIALSLGVMPTLALAQTQGQIRIFIVNPHGDPVPRLIPAAASIRTKEEGGPNQWNAPRTVSNQQTPSAFNGTLALATNAGPYETVAVGAYLPTGFEIYKMINDVPNCAWQNGTSAPSDKNLYQLYAPSHPTDGRQRQTLFMRGPESGVVCVTFMLVRDPSYAAYGKLNLAQYGRYVEKPWSSPMGLQNVRPDEIVTLRKTSTTAEIQLDVSKTIGATIVHFFVNDPGQGDDPSRIQLIKSADAGDSGLQWSIVARGIDYDSLKTDAVVNQAVGADPTWMWGMEVPLQFAENTPDSSVLRTPDNVWVPLYSDHWTLENADKRWDKEQFIPNAPLFQPLSLHLWDGRSEEISLKNIPVNNGHTISQVTSNFHVRSHLQAPVSMDFYRTFLWSAYNMAGPFGGLAHHLQITVVKADGSRLFLGADHAASSLEQPWHVEGFGRAKGGPCTPDSCAGIFENVSHIVLVYDPCPSNRCATREKVVSVHLPDNKPFQAEIRSKGGKNAMFGIFIDFTVQGRPLNARSATPGASQLPFTMQPDYNNGPDGQGDAVIYSIGSNADLNSLPAPMGY